MLKFNPNYSLSVEKNSSDDILLIKPPFTIEFDIFRNTLASANEAVIKVYNLSEKNRSELRKDINNEGRRKDISLIAGYDNSMAIIFSGQVRQAWSERQGVDFITEIRCFDGGFGFANSQLALQFSAGTPRQKVIDEIVKTLGQHGIFPGTISPVSGTIPRGNSYSGGTLDELSRIAEGALFVDNGLLYILGDDECTADAIIEVNSDSGLLGTPVREDLFTRINLIFDPRFSLGRRVELVSTTDDSFQRASLPPNSVESSSFSGLYKVMSIAHRGMISPTVASPITTSVQLLSGYAELQAIARGIPL